MIGMAVAMLVNARSSNPEPNQEADRNPKRLSERDSLLFEKAHCVIPPLTIMATPVQEIVLLAISSFRLKCPRGWTMQYQPGG